jgi:YidC/Oxa1 family membrane protein insertase
MINIFYDLIIFPIEHIIEVIYTLIYKVFDTPVIALIGVSLAVTLLSLPFYIIAEKMQETERQTINRLKPKIDKIKQVFKGDEQYMILSTYYRQNGYHPLYALRNSLNIIIQIPFFIAAYNFITHLESLRGVPLSYIADLGRPDALFNIGGYPINILPIIMTLINCYAGAVYTKQLGLRDRLQVYGTAFVFLILLYNSPSGLVLYWTMNNALSLVKNIFYKVKKPARLLYFIMCGCIILFILYLLFVNNGALKKRLILSLFCVFIPFIPFIANLYFCLQNHFLSPLMNNDKKRLLLFISLCAGLAVLTGLSIPSTTIASSPEEFSFIDAYQSPVFFIFDAFFKSFGIFIFWSLCVYLMLDKKKQTFLAVTFMAILSIALLNVFVFFGKYSAISNTFTFTNSLSPLNASIQVSILNILCTLFLLALLLFLINKNKIKIIYTSCIMVFLSLIAFSAYNIFSIQKNFLNFAIQKKASLSDISSIQPVFHLSKDKPNILIIMADQAISGLVKPIFSAQPDLYEQFEGFTYFPNTLSFSMHTITGVPPIWGGYEYTPMEMNNRDSAALVEKHNEALLVIPKLLSESGFHVTVTDPSWANYASISDTGIYEQYDNIQAFNTIGRYTDLWYSANNFDLIDDTGEKIKRNILWFSYFRISPPFLRKIVYDDGNYWAVGKKIEPFKDFIDSYAILDFLPQLTAYDAAESSALLITNETTHKLILFEPDTGDGDFSNNRYFYVNRAFFRKIGEWFDVLKANNVYDNTRIIIVSDHGHNMDAKIADTPLPIPNERREAYNPVLLFKDFNSYGNLQTDMSFMTNADVPMLALDGVSKTINPFTGKSLSENPKADGVFITINHLWQPYNHKRNTFNINNNQWVFVKENIFDSENWEIVLK